MSHRNLIAMLSLAIVALVGCGDAGDPGAAPTSTLPGSTTTQASTTTTQATTTTTQAATTTTKATTTTTQATTTTTKATTTTTQPPETEASIDWSDPTVVVTFDDGWTIHKCEGDAPMLCVEKDGEAVGSVEAAAFPISSFPDLDPKADDATNLEGYAKGYFTAFAEDRAEGCGADYAFTPIDTAAFDLGGTSGVSFGFVGTMPDGSPSELNLQYATIVDADFVSIVAAAYDEDGCPGRDDLSGFTSADLEAFQDHLELVLQESPLPPVSA